MKMTVMLCEMNTIRFVFIVFVKFHNIQVGLKDDCFSHRVVSKSNARGASSVKSTIFAIMSILTEIDCLHCSDHDQI